MSRRLHIAREDSELGVLTEAETVELLQAGFLQPTDLYWTPGMSDWESLSEFKAEPERPPGHSALMKRATERLKSASEVAVSQAIKLTDRLKSASGDRLKDSAHQMLHAFTPQLQKLVASQLVEHPVAQVRAATQDDALMRKIFAATYDCLPKPFYRFVTEEAFVQFCMERRKELLCSSS